jgi:CBS domain-containing protein
MPANPDSKRIKPVPLKAVAGKKRGVLHPDDSVEIAGDRMRKHDAASWPVAEDTKLVGTIDEKNPDWKVGGHGHDPKDCKVGQIMSRSLIFCYEDEDCTHAEKVMREHRLAYLPVVDRQMRIVGVFSRNEIGEMASADTERQRIARHAMKIARDDGRAAFTDDDFARAAADLAEGRSRGEDLKSNEAPAPPAKTV